MTAEKARRILWVDDEIELLRSHVLFLSERGFLVTTASNGEDAVSLLQQAQFDLVLLDEIMPGRDGLSTLSAIRGLKPSLPVVMVTKSEAEDLVDSALARSISDFLVKPLNPRQVLSTCKRILEGTHRAQEKRSRDYVQEYREFQKRREQNPGWREWIDLQLWLAEWDLELERLPDAGLSATHQAEKLEADRLFGRFVEANYPRWIRGEEGPLLSPRLVENHIVPLLKGGKKVCFVVMDCMPA